MNRVVITGQGIVSALGHSVPAVLQALQAGQSAIAFQPSYAEAGMRSQIAALPNLAELPHIDRKLRRYMSEPAQFAWHAAQAAIAESGLTPAQIADPSTGVILGEGVGSMTASQEAMDTLKAQGIQKVLPYMVPRIMGHTAVASLVTGLGVQGVSYAISSACASAAHAIGQGFDEIRLGRHTTMLVGGVEEGHWTMAFPFDAMGALAQKSNAHPAIACRPFSADREGFVMAGGGAVLVLEEYEQAKRRGAPILAEITGYGMSSDGGDMVFPSAVGCARAISMALKQSGHKIDYVNAHATGTPQGDISEINALKIAFGADHVPPVSSTKGLSGHSIGAAGAFEAVFSLAMLREQFIAGCATTTVLDEECAGVEVVLQSRPAKVQHVLSNSFGFGGTNAALIFSQCA